MTSYEFYLPNLELLQELFLGPLTTSHIWVFDPEIFVLDKSLITNPEEPAVRLQFRFADFPIDGDACVMEDNPTIGIVQLAGRSL